MALRWKKNERPRGLAGVGADPQGSTLRDGEKEFARTGFISKRHGHAVEGWYFVARNDAAGVKLKNTCGEPVSDQEAAKAAAMAYVRACIKTSQGEAK